MTVEIWKDIEGYEKVYQVSNLGRVRSLDRIVNGKVKGFKNKVNGKILKNIKGKNGYYTVGLSLKGLVTNNYVHRLVATAFIPKLDNKPFVNHKDEDKTNNNVNNLEWITNKDNLNYGTARKRQAKAISKPIKVIYQDGTYEYWESATILANEFGISKKNISQVLNKKNKTYFGMKFEFKTEGN